MLARGSAASELCRSQTRSLSKPLSSSTRSISNSPSRFLTACTGPPPTAESRAGSFPCRLASRPRRSAPGSLSLLLQLPPSFVSSYFDVPPTPPPRQIAFLRLRVAVAPPAPGIGWAELSHVSRPVRYYARLQKEGRSGANGQLPEVCAQILEILGLSCCISNPRRDHKDPARPAPPCPNLPVIPRTGAGVTTTQGEGGGCRGHPAPQHGTVAARRSPFTSRAVVFTYVFTYFYSPAAAPRGVGTFT